MVREMF